MFKTNLATSSLCLALLAGCTQNSTTDSSAEIESGFTSLFDGKSLAGWKAYMDDPIENAWRFSPPRPKKHDFRRNRKTSAHWPRSIQR